MPWIKKAAPKPRTRRPDGLRKKEAAAIYNKQAWKRLRAAVVERMPWCVACLCRRESPALTIAEEVHHLRPIMAGQGRDARLRLAYDPGNLCPLCRSCHRLLHLQGLKGIDTDAFRTVLDTLHEGATPERMAETVTTILERSESEKI